VDSVLQRDLLLEVLPQFFVQLQLLRLAHASVGFQSDELDFRQGEVERTTQLFDD
jgi:hypothetical protein